MMAAVASISVNSGTMCGFTWFIYGLDNRKMRGVTRGAVGGVYLSAGNESLPLPSAKGETRAGVALLRMVYFEFKACGAGTPSRIFLFFLHFSGIVLIDSLRQKKIS